MKYGFRAFVLFLGIVGLHIWFQFQELTDFDIGAEVKEKIKTIIKGMLAICFSLAAYLTQIELRNESKKS